MSPTNARCGRRNLPPCTEVGTTLKFDPKTRQIEIVDIGKLRFWFAMGANAFRLTIACCLFVLGTLYVGRTAQIDELLLNAIALEFVISVDELIFDGLMPRACMCRAASNRNDPLSSNDARTAATPGSFCLLRA